MWFPYGSNLKLKKWCNIIGWVRKKLPVGVQIDQSVRNNSGPAIKKLGIDHSNSLAKLRKDAVFKI
jgi:hypothetical protein